VRAIERGRRQGTLVQPYGVPPRWLGWLPGTPGLPIPEASGPHPPTFATLTRTLAHGAGVNIDTLPGGIDAFWAPVIEMGITEAELHAEAARVGNDPAAFGAWLVQTGAAWDAANLRPLVTQLEACARDGQELERMMGFAVSVYQANARPPLVPGWRWPSDERAALAATVQEFCPTPPPEPIDFVALDPSASGAAPAPEKKDDTTMYWIAGGIGLAALAGAGLYVATRKKRR